MSNKHEKKHTDWPLLLTFILIETIVFFFFVFGTDYAEFASDSTKDTVANFYSFYQDVHVMIFIGFGFLMTFPRMHGYSSLGMTFIIGVVSIQLSIVFNKSIHALWSKHLDKTLTVKTLITGDFAAGAVLISYGAMLGRLKTAQVLWMLIFELIFYAINECLGVETFHAVDMGGSMFVHTFGAYFGLGFSYMWGNTDDPKKDNQARYHSDMFAMIGTIFLWMFWPSFNGALAKSEEAGLTDVSKLSQERVVINTVLSLCCSCVSAFAFSHYFKGEFDMVHIQNATLAGGVAVGSSCDLVIGPFAAIIIGTLAGFISVSGYHLLSDPLERKGIQDVCGVHNLHGMPGVLGGISGAIAAAAATTEVYGSDITSVFGERATRTAAEQGLFQGAALLCTLFISFFGGMFSAFIIKLLPLHDKTTPFNDGDEWEVADSYTYHNVTVKKDNLDNDAIEIEMVEEGAEVDKMDSKI